MNTITSCSRLSDSELCAALANGTGAERKATAHVVALLAEFDGRQLYLAEGYRSLFVYCTEVLRFSEDAAYARIQAARASRQWPQVLDVLRDGSVTLTAIGLLAPHLTDANVDAVMAQAFHKRKEDVKLIVARLAPKPDVASLVRKLPTPARLPAATRPNEPAWECRSAERPAAELAEEPALRCSGAPGIGAAPALPAKPAVVAPLSPERYKIQVTVDRETRDVLRQAQDLMRHSIPNGDPAAIIARALRVLVDDLLKKKMAATTKPRPARRLDEGSRTIPAAVRRDVWRRDGAQCAFAGSRGRCPERGALEYHHVIPYAMGGEASADNIELRCRAHNAHEARLAGLPLGPDDTALPALST